MNTPEEISKLILQEIGYVHEHRSQNAYESSKALTRLFELVAELLSAEAGINFVSLFSRLSYISERHLLPRPLKLASHVIRKGIEKGLCEIEDLRSFSELVETCLSTLATFLIGGKADFAPLETLLLPYNLERSAILKGKKALIEGLILSINLENATCIFVDEMEPDLKYTVRFDVLETNDRFTKNLKAAASVFDFPIPTNLIDTYIDDHHILTPSGFVLYPDYLVDVTTIASIQGDRAVSPWLYILNKFKPHQSSPALMIGNAVNFFLDKLIKDPSIELPSLHKELFAMDTMSWIRFDDETIEEIFHKLQLHFENLKRVIKEDFPIKGIQKGKIYLEPSFYCRDYGIQGRLDLFHINDERTKAEIIELKSTKPFKPNKYGISSAHYIQTILYEMIINSTYKGAIKPTNYILYSVLAEDNLKPAYGMRELTYEILKTRNEIVTIEYGLAHDRDLAGKVFHYLRSENMPALKGFMLQDLKQFEDIYASLDGFEKIYMQRFTNFVAKEHLLAKTGEHGGEKSNGLSGLWLESLEEKSERFGIFNHLQIVKNDSDEPFPVIILKKTGATARLANFRQGDIAVLYPHQHNTRQVLHHEIFKCTILEIGEGEITVRMRHSQLNQHLFKTTAFWNLEVDVLDSSFRHMYRNLFEFASASTEKRALLLGQQSPAFNEQEVIVTLDDALTIQQKSIVRKILQTKDYLLLWGPPGTGKTSVIIKNAAYHLYRTSEERVIYLAYTNRAVDEICDALTAAGLREDFIRIGSRYSVGAQYVDRLLEERIKDFTKRSQIVGELEKCRIFVSTVSSLHSKPELFDLLKFKTAIVDEASQILEPQMIGLLTRFERFVLIGDHKQLPAVVAQAPQHTVIHDQELIDKGITNMAMSYFERLYRQCTKNNWSHSMELLSQQGRMHQELMQFPGEYFYENKLQLVPKVDRLQRALRIEPQTLLNHRMIYIPTQVDTGWQWKINKDEAQVIVNVSVKIFEYYQQHGLSWNESTLGVIVPYKAQIALVKNLLGDKVPEVTIDTVERYQGGARDIIIYGVCTNRPRQMQMLVSKNEEGVDRKLNVAITRARERLIIVGNEAILQSDVNYGKLISLAEKVSPESI